MELGMSGPPGACAHPPVAAATVTVPAHASCPRTEESLATAQRNKPSSATSLSAQVRTSGKKLLIFKTLTTDSCESIWPLKWLIYIWEIIKPLIGIPVVPKHQLQWQVDIKSDASRERRKKPLWVLVSTTTAGDSRCTHGHSVHHFFPFLPPTHVPKLTLKSHMQLVRVVFYTFFALLLVESIIIRVSKMKSFFISSVIHSPLLLLVAISRCLHAPADSILMSKRRGAVL